MGGGHGGEQTQFVFLHCHGAGVSDGRGKWSGWRGIGFHTQKDASEG